MNARQSLTAAVALVLGIAIGAAISRPTAAQQQPPNAPARYQLAVGGVAGHPVVMDSNTGRCWRLVLDLQTEKTTWDDLGTPPPNPNGAKGN